MKYTQSELRTLERYAQDIFGCSFDDLSTEEETMLIFHVQEKEPTFLARFGVD